MAVRITTLAPYNSGEQNKVYVAYTREDCKGDIDLEVFKMVLDRKETVYTLRHIGEYITASTFTDLRWSGKGAVPAIGASVHVGLNNIGPGTVESYFAEEGWLGVMVSLKNPPEWYIRQNGADAHAHIYGSEMDFLNSGPEQDNQAKGQEDERNSTL